MAFVLVLSAFAAHAQERTTQIAPSSLDTANALQSWNDTEPKRAIVDFVREVTTEGGTNFVARSDRIAVFDMDGTLLVEKPVPAAVIPLKEGIRQAVAKTPSLKQKPAIAALIKGDVRAVAAMGERGVADIISAVTHGLTAEDAASHIRALIAVSRHPRFERLFTELAYQPMLELLSFLRANGFQTWICSGSPVVFTRQFSQDVFGVPPNQVMGTSVATRFVERDGRGVLVYSDKLEHINDKDGKPPTINLAVGRRPLLVGGNVLSGGDIAMMRYSKSRPGPSLQLLINHDDEEREYSYAEKDEVSLRAARQFGFTVVSMKNDWNRIFAL